MSKFKIGNKVKILSTNNVDGISSHGVEVAMVGEVVHLYENGADVKHPSFKYVWWRIDDCYLELVED